jgi:hypothetical protein
MTLMYIYIYKYKTMNMIAKFKNGNFYYIQEEKDILRAFADSIGIMNTLNYKEEKFQLLLKI